ncbi:phage tail protein [Emticicia sp. CRIBPO]|uniref:phage tail protein n=1 Tax=Emticicia sp. CRIBPO TaxID=2683258 RepID=UPI0014121AA5|nr:tail fiber protein [Emticicia sp. CRIBPO]NBA88067.1 phage tail protein [Emticicia sp. CRIBPO]
MDNYVGEIRIFAGNFAPVGWAPCDGRLLSIAEYEVLFNLFGTIYGGDGQHTFGLPDLRGRVVVNAGTASYGGQYNLGVPGGQERVTLKITEMPQHNHNFMVSTMEGNSTTAGNFYYGAPVAPADPPSANKQIVFYQPDTAGEVKSTFMASTIQPVGGNLPHENRQPYLPITYIVALNGIYPSPS